MSTFAKTGFRSGNYNSLRPHYPESFYKILMEYIGKDKVEKTIDLGCGSGVATYPLLKWSKRVFGLDLSPPMIQTANSLKAKKLEELSISDENRIDFEVCAVEDFEAPPSSFDLITAAECIHWFKDYSKFFSAAALQLKTNGVLAYWFYVDPVIVSFEGPHDASKRVQELLRQASSIYMKFVYDDPQYLKKHWEQPGRNILSDYLQKVDSNIPTDLFTDIKIQKYHPTFDRKLSPSEKDLRIIGEKVTLVDYVNYLSTYSLFHNYSELTNKGPELWELIVSTFEKELGWNRNKTLIDICWHTGYTFMRKK